MAYSGVTSQGSMLFDERRNRAYLAALEVVVTPESVVLDLGAGIGVHGLLAAKLGAKRVHLVEPENVIHVAKQVAFDNGLAERVVCHQGRIEQVELPEKVDVIVSVFTGNLLLSEDLLPSLFYARDRYLKPGGALIPDQARLVAAPASAPALYAKRVDIWAEPHLGIDFRAGRPYAANAVLFERDRLRRDLTYLAEPATLLELDFTTATDAACRATVAYEVTEPGLCHGIAGWFDMRLGDQWLSTAPHEPRLHWSPALLPLDKPVEVSAGERVALRLIRRPFDEWHWRVETASGAQQMSGFKGRVLAPGKWQLQTMNATPHLSIEGQAQRFILSQFDGTQSVTAIAAAVRERWPELGWSSDQAERRVSNLAQRYGTLDPPP